LPALDFVVWVVEVGHTEEEIGSDLQEREKSEWRSV
jgi:hypothetical protein